MTRRGVSLALALLGVVLLTVGTGGFSSVDTDRSVRIGVADDENGFVGVEQGNQSLSNGVHEDVALLTLRNQFNGNALEVSNVELAESDDSRPPRIRNVSVASDADGSTKTIVADVTCASNTNNTEVVTVSVDLSGTDDEFSVQLARDVRIICTGDAPGEQSNRTADGR